MEKGSEKKEVIEKLKSSRHEELDSLNETIENIKIKLDMIKCDCQKFLFLDEEVKVSSLSFLQAREKAVNTLNKSFHLRVQSVISNMKSLLYQGELMYNQRFSKKSRKRARIESDLN
jgi:hypothetical protein